MSDWRNVLWAAATMGGAAGAALIAHHLLFSAAKRIAARTPGAVDASLVRNSSGPAKLIFVVVALFATLFGVRLPDPLDNAIRHVLSILLIAAVAWLAARMLNVLEDVLAARYGFGREEDLTARKIRTQYAVLRRIGIAVILVVALAGIMMTFPSVWNLGAGLFASAGVAGLIAGMAARPVIANLLAGLQIALSEPIRIDDIVVVEGEWGRIEEIGASYVIVKTWDLRRLVVPLTYFVEKPFQNWTRETTDLLGTVLIYADYGVPVDEVRRELHGILESSGLWDGKTWGLQVTNATERSMELRALMSAPNASAAWDLRCYVREKLIEYLRKRCPESLPRVRVVH